MDEGCLRAGQLLTARAVTKGDLLELQRISDAGYDEAGHELDRLLAGPTTKGRSAEAGSTPGATQVTGLHRSSTQEAVS